LSVSIIGVNAKEGKLIFSEKDPSSDEKEKIMELLVMQLFLHFLNQSP
jgi:hypothetical protein